MKIWVRDGKIPEICGQRDEKTFSRTKTSWNRNRGTKEENTEQLQAKLSNRD